MDLPKATKFVVELRFEYRQLSLNAYLSSYIITDEYTFTHTFAHTRVHSCKHILSLALSI
jgi:hypothetical protein